MTGGYGALQRNGTEREPEGQGHALCRICVLVEAGGDGDRTTFTTWKDLQESSGWRDPALPETLMHLRFKEGHAVCWRLLLFLRSCES